MLKNRVLAALAIGSLTFSPAIAKDTRSSQSLPPASAKASPQSQERHALLFQVAAAEPCESGNGKKLGHENGRRVGIENGTANPNACGGKSPG